jgi:glycosyltransferase involved in cell wall biosynthesis
MARITVDYTPAVHQGAGIGRLTRELAQALLKVPSTHTFSFFVMGKPPRDVPLSNVMHTAHLPLRVGRYTDRWLYRVWFKANIPLPVQTWSGPCDLYHATDFVLPPLQPGTPSVLTVHDLSFERDPGSAPPRLIPFLKKVVPASARRANHIVADSYATARDLITLYGISPDKITTIHSGVHPRFSPFNGTLFQQRRRDYVLKKYNIADSPFVLAVGTMQPRKNHLRLVQAFAEIVKGGVGRGEGTRSSHHAPHSTLIIAGGKGWLYDEVLAEVKRLGIEDRVKFIGFADDVDLPHLYRAARVFAFPSIYEGFGLPILEAMASGVPVVASNASSLPEVVGDAGAQIDPFDVNALALALDTALHDEAWRRQAIERGLARIAEFTWTRAAEQLLSVYERVLA